ncbi:MAG TPA: PAS domain S-box protein, partial [Burkholderiaceae bacterium]|nr:PAS domain S-box protein [Burkholderiaceae bacterium]
QVFSEMQTEREIDEFHAPSAARAEELLYALARLRTPLGANALTVSQVDPPRFTTLGTSNYRSVRAMAEDLLARCKRHPPEGFETLCPRLERALGEARAVEAQAQGDLLRLALALANQPLALETVAAQLARFHRHEIDVLRAAQARQERLFWSGFAVLLLGVALGVGREARRQFAMINAAEERERALAASLRLSEERLRRAFDASPIGMTLADSGSQMNTVNPAFVQMMGYSAEELQQADFLALTHPADRPRNRELLEAVRAGTLPKYRYEKRMRRKDGRYVWVAVTTAPWIGPEGSVSGVISLVEDITEARRLQQALSSERRFVDSVLSSAPMLVVVLDAGGRVRRFNRAAEALTGRSYGEVAGREAWDVLCAPGDIERFRREAFEPLLRGEAAQHPGMTCECVAAGGALRRIEWRTSVLPSPDGAPEFAVCTGMDVTERDLTQAALHAAHARLEAILSAVPDLWFVIDRDGRYIDVSDPGHPSLAVPWARVQGRAFGEVLPRGLADRLTAVVQRARTLGVPQEVEYELDALGGAQHSFEARVVPMRDGNCLYLTRDITDRKRAEHALRDALQERELLLKEIYHRVKNNLQMVSSLLTLQSRIKADEQSRELLLDSARRIKSMALVHEQLYGAGNLTGVPFAAYATQLVAHLADSFGGARQLDIQCNIEPVELGIETAVPLGLIINELVSNACKHAFADGNGTVRVELVHRDGGALELTVADDGRGLPPDFAPERARSLGMQLVLSLAGQLDGSLAWGPDGDAGTAFRLRFTPAEPEAQRLRMN